MARLLSIVEGWTATLPTFTLTWVPPSGHADYDGADVFVPFDLTDYTVTLWLNGTEAAGTVTALDQGDYPGQVTYTPASATDFEVASGQLQTAYRVHWEVIDGDEKSVYFQNAAGDEIMVHKK